MNVCDPSPVNAATSGGSPSFHTTPIHPGPARTSAIRTLPRRRISTETTSCPQRKTACSIQGRGFDGVQPDFPLMRRCSVRRSMLRFERSSSSWLPPPPETHSHPSASVRLNSSERRTSVPSRFGPNPTTTARPPCRSTSNATNLPLDCGNGEGHGPSLSMTAFAVSTSGHQFVGTVTSLAEKFTKASLSACDKRTFRLSPWCRRARRPGPAWLVGAPMGPTAAHRPDVVGIRASHRTSRRCQLSRDRRTTGLAKSELSITRSAAADGLTSAT